MCNGITGMIIERLQNELNTKEKKRFDKHIKKCIECRRKYHFIIANYDSSLGTTFCIRTKEGREADSELSIGYNQNELVQNVISRIDTSRYDVSSTLNRAPVPKNMKVKYALVCLVVIVSLSLTAFAKPIYKSLGELLETISSNHNILLKQAAGDIKNSNTKKITEEEFIKRKKSFEEADALYDKYKQEVESTIAEMKTGEIKTLTFEGECDDFYISIGKGMETKTVIYGIKGISGQKYLGDIPFAYRAGSDNKDMSIQELKEQGYFIPVLEYLPEDYEFSYVRFNRDEIGAVEYKNIESKENDYISIYLATDRVDIDEDVEKQLEVINGYQAIYIEEEGAGNRFGKFIIYLGEDKRLKVLTLTAKLKEGFLEKSDLYDIAQGMKYYNLEGNEITYNGYFKNVKDAVPQQKLDEFYEKIKKGEKNIRIQLEDDVRLSRKEGSGKSETYYIEYIGNNVQKIRQYSNYPMLMNSKIYDESILENFAVIGVGYRWDKEVWFNIKSCDANEADSEKPSTNSGTGTAARVDARITARALDSRLKQYPTFDIVIDDYVSCMNNEVTHEELIFDKDNHPYIVTGARFRDAKGKETIYGRYFRTVKEVAGEYVHYNIIVPETMLKGMNDQEFVDGLGFIE